MQVSRLRNGISYGLIMFFAVVLAKGTTAFASSLVLGAFFRLVLLPLVVLMVLLVVVQTWEQGRGIPRFSLSTVVFILPISLLVGVLIVRFGEALNLVSVSVLVLVIVCYFLSLYFIIVDKDHYALALLMLSVPWIEFMAWDSGIKWGLFKLEIGHITLPIKGIYIVIASIFWFWAANKAVRRRFHLTELRRYVPVVLLLLYSLTSILLFTYSHNQGPAVNRIASMMIFPLLVYIMMIETVDTKDKLYLMAYSAVAMVVMSTFLNYYMSYRTLGIAFNITGMAVDSGLVRYGTGSPTVKAIELALITPLLLALWVTVRDRRYVLPFIGLIVFVVVAQLMAFNRGGLLAALAGAVCLLRNRRVQLFAILVLIITAVFWEPFYNYFLVRFHNIYSLDILDLRNLSYGRYQGWIAAIEMIREQPILGVGLSNFGDYAHLFSAPYPALSPRGEEILVYMSDAHNLFLEVGAELGLIGLGILLLFLGMLLFDLVRGLFAVKGSKLAPLGWGLVGVYIATIVLSTTADGFWVAKASLGHNVLYWTLFALMGRLRWVGKRMNSGTIAGN